MKESHVLLFFLFAFAVVVVFAAVLPSKFDTTIDAYPVKIVIPGGVEIQSLNLEVTMKNGDKYEHRRVFVEKP